MKTMHFTELADHKVSTIERGRVYYYCHPICGDYLDGWFPMDEHDTWRRPTAQASTYLALSGLVQRTANETLFARLPQDRPGSGQFDVKRSMWLSTSGNRDRWFGNRLITHWNFAGDSGIDGGDGYVGGNFVLDKNDLLRQGIQVDLTSLDLPAYSPIGGRYGRGTTPDWTPAQQKHGW